MAMRGSRLLWLAAVVVAAGGALVFALARRGDTQSAPVVRDPVSAVPSPQGEAPALVVAPLPTPASAGIPLEDCITYPDGTKLPPLNGVKKAPPVVFHRLIPFTKVLRKEFDKASGLEWYVHENGARSTTRLQWRNGVQEAVGELSMPTKSQPMVDDK